MLICSKDCFDSTKAFYYRKGTAYERSDISAAGLLQYFTDEAAFRKDQAAQLEREMKSVSSVSNVSQEVAREVKTRRKMQEVDE